MNIAHHICLALTISPNFSIVLFWRTRHLRKKNLSYIHTWSQNNRNRVHICELKCDIEIMSRIDKSCSIMDDEAKSSKRWFTRKLDKVFLRTKFLNTCTKYGNTRTKDKSFFFRHHNLFIFGQNLVHRVDIHHRIILYNQEPVTKPDIITRWLKTSRIKVRNRNITRLYTSTDVSIGKIHKITVKKIKD